MAAKGRLLALGVLSIIGMFSFRADEGVHFVLPTTKTPRLRSSFADFPRITVNEYNITEIPLKPVEDIGQEVLDDVDIPPRILMTNNPFAEIVMHAECIAQCERRIFDAYIR